MDLDAPAQLNKRALLTAGIAVLLAAEVPAVLYYLLAGGMGVGTLPEVQRVFYSAVLQTLGLWVLLGVPAALAFAAIGTWRKAPWTWFVAAGGLALAPVLIVGVACFGP
jgi:hypothetical protein